jgi:hypothetical protein
MSTIVCEPPLARGGTKESPAVAEQVSLLALATSPDLFVVRASRDTMLRANDTFQYIYNLEKVNSLL